MFRESTQLVPVRPKLQPATAGQQSSQQNNHHSNELLLKSSVDGGDLIEVVEEDLLSAEGLNKEACDYNKTDCDN